MERGTILEHKTTGRLLRVTSVEDGYVKYCGVGGSGYMSAAQESKIATVYRVLSDNSARNAQIADWMAYHGLTGFDHDKYWPLAMIMDYAQALMDDAKREIEKVRREIG